MEGDVTQTARRRAYSVNSAAEVIGAGRDGVYAAIRSGQLRARKFGRRTLILDEDLTDFLRKLPDADLTDAVNPCRENRGSKGVLGLGKFAAA
jgi:excisionase family DNA binding protein